MVSSGAVTALGGLDETDESFEEFFGGVLLGASSMIRRATMSKTSTARGADQASQYPTSCNSPPATMGPEMTPVVTNDMAVPITLPIFS